MSAAESTGEPMEHARTPPGARKFPRPTPESIGPFADALRSMQGSFWTADVLAILKMRDVPGYKGNSGNQRAQGMLDFLGYRVIETKRNRNGYAYRWVLDPNAVVGQPQTAAERATKAAATRKAQHPTPVPGARKAARGKAWVEPEPRPVARAAPILTPAERREQVAAAEIRAQVDQVAEKVKRETLERRAAPPKPQPEPEPAVTAEPSGREFIDTVESWTADRLPEHLTVGDLTATLEALGLRWEIRVWRP